MGAGAGEVEALDPAEAPRPKRRSSSWSPSISPWKMWPPVMPKRASSSRGPSARRSTMRSGSSRADLGEARDRRVGGRVGVGVDAESTGRTATGRDGPAARASGRRPSGRRPRSRGAPRAGPARASAAACSRSASVKPMSIVPAHGSGPGQLGSRAGRRAAASPSRPAGLAPAVRRGKPGERRGAQRVGVRQHGARAHLAPVLEHHAAGPPRPRPARARPAPRRAPARPPPRPPRAAPP